MAQNDTGEDVLKGIATSWLKKIELGLKHKRPFSDDAREAMDFFDGPHNWFWKNEYARNEAGYNRSITPPGFRMQINRVFEAVKLFASVIYHRNPNRQVTPKKFPEITPDALGLDPNNPEVVQQYQMAMQDTVMRSSIRDVVSRLMSAYLNYTPNELDLKTHSRRVVDEAIIKGGGCWWTEMVTDPGSQGRAVGLCRHPGAGSRRHRDRGHHLVRASMHSPDRRGRQAVRHRRREAARQPRGALVS